MSTTNNPTSNKGIRYTDEQKKEITNFVADYNAANNRGGQAKASEKYGVSQLTISNWIKGSGTSSKKGKKAAKAPKAAKAAKAAKAPKAAKAAKAPKASKGEKAPKAAKKAKSGRGGSRYTAEQKQEVVTFVADYNAANGRGGQSKAAEKFGVSPLTVMAWLKAAGVTKGSSKPAKAPKATKAAKPGRKPGRKPAATGGDFDEKLTNLLALSKGVAKAQVELDRAIAKFESAKAAL
jgi:transposase-like protein